MQNKLGNRVASAASSESGSRHVRLIFTPEALDHLREVKELAGAKTDAEVVRNAIRLYEWFLRQQRENYKLQLVRDEKVTEVEILFRA